MLEDTTHRMNIDNISVFITKLEEIQLPITGMPPIRKTLSDLIHQSIAKLRKAKNYLSSDIHTSFESGSDNKSEDNARERQINSFQFFCGCFFGYAASSGTPIDLNNTMTKGKSL